MINIALFGPPGAGKGTQSEKLIEKFNLFYISTGDILRKEIKEETKLGLEAKSIIESGGLVSDEIIVQIIEKTITENPNVGGFLFDGFPRTFVQAYILEGLMIKLNTALHCLINLKVDEEEAVKRLLERGKTSGRADDNEVIIRNRLNEYNQKTLSVLDFYKGKGIVNEVNGLQPIEDVNKDIREAIKVELKKRLYNIVIFGYPGSGRGSQGKALAEKFGLEYISTGKMLDDEIVNDTEIGRSIKELFSKGKLVPDEILIKMIEAKINNSKGNKGFIFKGYPRTLVQSYILDGMLRKHSSRISHIIELEVPTLELIARLSARSKTEKCRSYDSTTDLIVKRLMEHEKMTVPVIEKFNQLHGVTKINGVGTQEEVFQRISDVVQERMKRTR